MALVRLEDERKGHISMKPREVQACRRSSDTLSLNFLSQPRYGHVLELQMANETVVSGVAEVNMAFNRRSKKHRQILWVEV